MASSSSVTPGPAPAGASPSQPPQAASESPSSGWTRAEKILTLITAVVTLLAAVLGAVSIQASQAKSEAQSTVADQSADVESLQQRIETLQQTNADQAERIVGLEEELASNSPPADPGTAPSGTESPAVRHQGAVTLASGGDAIDLNTPANDPLWAAGTVTGYEPDNMSYYDGTIYLRDVDAVALGQGETPSYETCSSKTGYAPLYFFEAASLNVNVANTCLRTDSGRFATFKLTSLASNSVTLELTTWEIP